MDFKTAHVLGIIFIFIGLFSLMSMHISHPLLEEKSTSESISWEFKEWSHIAFGFPISLLGVWLLILAEREQTAV